MPLEIGYINLLSYKLHFSATPAHLLRAGIFHRLPVFLTMMCPFVPVFKGVVIRNGHMAAGFIDAQVCDSRN